MAARVMLFVALAGCGIAFQRKLTTDEVPPGTCAKTKLQTGESCRPDSHDYAAVLVANAPHAHPSDVGATATFRMPMVDFGLDERTLYRGETAHHSLAGTVGTHLRPMLFWPEIARYVDVIFGLGFELGGIDMDSHLEGRGDGYLGLALELALPDAGPLKYFETGVPALRVGARYTGYVMGWPSETTYEVGLVWRWGDPIEVYRHWTWQRTGD